MRSARSRAARTAGSSSTTMTVGAASGAEAAVMAGGWTAPGRGAGLGGTGDVPVRTPARPQGSRKGRLKVPEETLMPPRRRAGASGPPRGVRGAWWVLVGSGPELDLDLTRVAAALDGERDRVARLVAVDRGHERVRGVDALALDRGDDVAGAQAGTRAGAAADRLRHRGAAAGGRVGELHAEVGVSDLAAGDQLLRDALDRARRDREADAVAAARVALDLGVDADHLAARVEQRPARVAVVDRRVGLDRARDREVVRRLDGAVQRAHDARGDGVLEAERAADRDRAVADLDAVRVGERQRVQLGLGRVDLDDGDVGRRVGADDLRARGLAVGEGDGDRGRAVDDVLVGGDVAVRVDHEARALGLRLLTGAVAVAIAAAELVGAGARGLADLDVDDAGVRLAIDLVDGEAAARLHGGGGVRGRGRRREGGRRRRRAPGLGEAVDGGAAGARRQGDGDEGCGCSAGVIVGAPGSAFGSGWRGWVGGVLLGGRVSWNRRALKGTSAWDQGGLRHPRDDRHDRGPPPWPRIRCIGADRRPDPRSPPGVAVGLARRRVGRAAGRDRARARGLVALQPGDRD